MMQLLAIYLAHLHRIIGLHNASFQGRDPPPPYLLESDFCLCMAVMLLEGWAALPAFGGNARFLKTADDMLQLKPSNAKVVTHEKLDLAQVNRCSALGSRRGGLGLIYSLPCPTHQVRVCESFILVSL